VSEALAVPVSQHGRGKEHLRKIELAPWQQVIASAHPERLLRGLIQSDGCRVLNRVNGTIYPRYQFTNHRATPRRRATRRRHQAEELT
jgi:hypothetical protein